MKEETILEKLERLFKKHRLIKAKKLKRIKDRKLQNIPCNIEDGEEEDYEADLLFQDEFMEEALKEYMYQFGLSIYQNKQGDYYFKKFIDENIRAFDELDRQHFAQSSREPNFFEKLLEIVPENRVCLISTIEKTVLDLSEKDLKMKELLEQMIKQETIKCDKILQNIENIEQKTQQDAFQKDTALGKTENSGNDIVEEVVLVDEGFQQQTESKEVVEKTFVNIKSVKQKTKRASSAKVSKVDQVSQKRSPKKVTPMAVISKDSSNER